MCPACLTTVTLAVVGATSTGGLAALIARRVRAKKDPQKRSHPADHRGAARSESKPHEEIEPCSRTASCLETNGSPRGSRF